MNETQNKLSLTGLEFRIGITIVICLLMCKLCELLGFSIQALAAKKNITIISTPYDAFTVARLIHQSIPVKFFMKKENLITFKKDDYLEQVKEVMSKNRYREFPIVNSKGKYF